MTSFIEVQSEDALDQGDVFTNIYFPAIDSNANSVVITPTCDLEQGKAHFIKFLASVSLDFVLKIIADSIGIDVSSFDSGIAITPRQCTNLIRAVRHNSNGDLLPRYYLVTSYQDIFPACYLDFQRIFVIPTLQVKEELMTKRIARIESPWKEQISSRYSGYSMRVGTPDYSDDEFKSLITLSGLTLPII